MSKLGVSLVCLAGLAAGSAAFGATLTGNAAGGGTTTLNFTGLAVFGDSLSDVGMVWAFSGGSTPSTSAGYAAGRFSNGPVWIEQLAATVGVLSPMTRAAAGNNYLPGYDNYAGGGAETGTGWNGASISVGNLQEQAGVYAYDHSYVVQPDRLCVIWAGANDILNGKSATTAAHNVAATVQGLKSVGATQFLVLNMPPLGIAPGVASNQKAAMTAAAVTFNTTLAANLALLDTGTTDILLFDAYALFTDMAGNPSAYGLTNVTGSAINDKPHADEYLFWDDLHPTTAAHGIIANAIVPEPTTLLVVSSGALLLLSRRKSRSLISKRRVA